jgi:hypothetical protein
MKPYLSLNVKPRRLVVASYRRFWDYCCPQIIFKLENVDSRYICDISKQVPDYMTAHSIGE